MLNSIKTKKLLTIFSLGASFLLTANAAAAEKSENLPSYELDKIVVTADKTKNDYGFVKKSAKVGIIAEKEVLDTPFNVVSFNEKAISSFAGAPEGVSAVLSLDPSVGVTTNTSCDQVTIRGFSINGHSMYLNGVPGMFGQYKMASNFVEAIDIVSGPGTGYNGTSYASSVGGTVNFQSKRAMAQPNLDLTISHTGRGFVEEKIDIGNRFGKNKMYGIRVNALNSKGEIAIPGAKLEQRNIFVNLDRKTTESESNLLVGYLINHQKARQKAASFKTGSVTVLPGVPDAKMNLAPEWAYDDHDNWMVTFNHNQNIAKDKVAFVNAGYHREDWYGYCSGSPTVQNNNGDFISSFTNYPLALTKRYVQVGLKGDFKLGKIKNEYVLSLDRNWYDYWINSKATIPGSFSGNLYKKIDWVAPAVPSVELTHKTTQSEMTGWAIMDTLHLAEDKLQVTVGVHGHRAEVNNFNSNTGSKNSTVESDGICPTVGITYKLNPNLSFYANHSENFAMGTLVASSYENAGQVLDPTKTKQNELGLKYKAGEFLHSISAFDIKKVNTIDVYKAGVIKPYLQADGEQNNKGFEYKATGELSDKLTLIGGFMYLDAKQTKTKGGVNDGLVVDGTSKWTATLGAEYKASKDYTLLFRGVYAGAAKINNQTLDVPAYTKFDFGVKYQTKLNETPVTITAMCYNVTNKNYWQGSSGSSSLYIGTPRTFMISAGFSF